MPYRNDSSLHIFRYILGVESPLICDILPQANEHGLMEMTPFMQQDQETAKVENHAESAFQESLDKLQKALG